MKTRWFGFGVMMLAFFLLFGCGKGGGAVANSKNVGGYNNEPITLVVNTAVKMNDDDFEKLIVGPTQKKYPNISFENKPGNADELIAAGTIPDLVFTSNAQINNQLDKGLGQDLTPMLKKYNINLERFEPEIVKNLKQIGKNGEIYGVPLDLNVGLMVYNKDIFDKFAAPYPKDEMNWTQVIELAKKVNRMDGGVQYIGADPGTAQSMIRQYSLPVVDEKKEKAVLTSDGYKKVFSVMRRFYDLPGYVGANKNYRYKADMFFKDQNIAMLPSWIDGLTTPLMDMIQKGNSMKWDVVSYPTYDDRPGLSKQVDFHMFMVPPTSQHQDAAFQVLQLLISDDAQNAMNRGSTRMTSLKSQDIKKTYTEDLGIFKNKNLQGIFKVKPAPAPISTVYDNKIYKILGDAQKDMALNGTDVNTALRQANEQANNVIVEINSGSK